MTDSAYYISSDKEWSGNQLHDGLLVLFAGGKQFGVEVVQYWVEKHDSEWGLWLKDRVVVDLTPLVGQTVVAFHADLYDEDLNYLGRMGDAQFGGVVS